MHWICSLSGISNTRDRDRAAIRSLGQKTPMVQIALGTEIPECTATPVTQDALDLLFIGNFKHPRSGPRRDKKPGTENTHGANRTWHRNSRMHSHSSYAGCIGFALYREFQTPEIGTAPR